MANNHQNNIEITLPIIYQEILKLKATIHNRSPTNSQNDVITVNVGGTRFDTLKGTLSAEKGTFFYSMLNDERFKSEENGEFFVDRDPKWFSTILNFYRKKKVRLSHLELFEICEIIDELEFYHTDNLLEKVSLIYEAKKITPELCEFVEECINASSKINYFDLSTKVDGNTGAIIISKMLATNTNIHTLYLSSLD